DGERGRGCAVQDSRGPAGDPVRAVPAPVLARRDSEHDQRPARPDEPRRAETAAAPRLRAPRRMAPEALPRPARRDRALADLRPLTPVLRRSRSPRFLLPRHLVDLARHLVSREAHPRRRFAARSLLTQTR